ncbi:MAG: adenylosuccinate lyase [Candidatus Margulisbacteria bacterium]|nr:adenylosuccinate lyase [Candidatus Margulisiibacteriota bacterium]
MISRYSRPDMAKVWDPTNKFQRWLDVELAACKAHVELGNIPKSAYDTIKAKASFNVKRIDEIEADIHHDVIAFLTCLAESIGDESRFVHLGLTSSDVVDTAFSLLIQDAGNLLLADIDTLMAALKEKAKKYKYTLTMGRTHGVHAEPTTVGLKLTIWFEEMKRNKQRLTQALAATNVGKISGAVGNYAHMPPKLEALVCSELGLQIAPVSTQVLQRDRHAEFMATLAIIAGSLEKMAVEIRGLQKTEFNEILEPFSKNQKGSSAMPHKKNPIICERVTGLSRVIRGYAITAFENQALWHERDISHSSSERIIFPDATICLDYMFGLMTKVIDGMTVNEQQMKLNIGKSYNVFFSQQLLLKMVQKGMLREDAYRIVQKNAHEAFDEQVLFDEKIKADPSIKTLLSDEELKAIFNFDSYSRHADEIFDRVYK